MRSVRLALLAACLVAGCGEDDRPSGAQEKRAPSPTAAAQAAPAECTPGGGDRLVTRAKFRPGDARVIRIEKQRSENGEEQEATATAKLEVLGARRLRWTSEDVVLAEPLPPEDFVMEYQVDRDGVYERLVNLDEVRDKARQMLDGLRGKHEADAEQRAVLKRLRELMLSDAFLQNSLTMDVSTLHGGYGADIAEGEKVQAPTELPNPFGGPPLPAHAQVANRGRDDRGCAHLSLRVKPQPGAIKRMVRQGFGSVVPGGTRFPRNLSLVHSAEYFYDEETGWVVEVEAVKDIRSGKSRRTDRTVMTLDAPVGG